MAHAHATGDGKALIVHCKYACFFPFEIIFSLLSCLFLLKSMHTRSHLLSVWYVCLVCLFFVCVCVCVDRRVWDLLSAVTVECVSSANADAMAGGAVTTAQLVRCYLPLFTHTHIHSSTLHSHIHAALCPAGLNADQCSSNGLCVNGSCQCSQGWTGEACETVASCPGSPQCSGHGVCVDNNTCLCDGAWRGNDCSTIACEHFHIFYFYFNFYEFCFTIAVCL